jgi:hypothetical protein
MAGVKSVVGARRGAEARIPEPELSSCSQGNCGAPRRTRSADTRFRNSCYWRSAASLLVRLWLPGAKSRLGRQPGTCWNTREHRVLLSQLLSALSPMAAPHRPRPPLVSTVSSTDRAYASSHRCRLRSSHRHAGSGQIGLPLLMGGLAAQVMSTLKEALSLWVIRLEWCSREDTTTGCQLHGVESSDGVMTVKDLDRLLGARATAS